MKVKLKKGERLTSNYSHCYLDPADWTALNQGKQVELNVVPKIIEDKIESIGSKVKGDK